MYSLGMSGSRNCPEGIWLALSLLPVCLHVPLPLPHALSMAHKPCVHLELGIAEACSGKPKQQAWGNTSWHLYNIEADEGHSTGIVQGVADAVGNEASQAIRPEAVPQ